MDPGNDMPSNCGHPGCTKQPSCGTASSMKAEFGAEHAPEDMNNLNHEFVERRPTYTHGLDIEAQVAACVRGAKHVAANTDEYAAGGLTEPEDMINLNHEHVERHQTYTHGLDIEAQVEALMRGFKHVAAHGDEYMAGGLTREQVAQRAATTATATLREMNLEADAEWKRSEAAQARARATSGAPHQMSHESDAKRRKV